MPLKRMSDLKSNQRAKLYTRPQAARTSDDGEHLNLYILKRKKSILEQEKRVVDEKKAKLENDLQRVQREIAKIEKLELEKQNTSNERKTEEGDIEKVEKKGLSKSLKTMRINY